MVRKQRNTRRLRKTGKLKLGIPRPGSLHQPHKLRREHKPKRLSLLTRLRRVGNLFLKMGLACSRNRWHHGRYLVHRRQLLRHLEQPVCSSCRPLEGQDQLWLKAT